MQSPEIFLVQKLLSGLPATVSPPPYLSPRAVCLPAYAVVIADPGGEPAVVVAAGLCPCRRGGGLNPRPHYSAPGKRLPSSGAVRLSAIDGGKNQWPPWSPLATQPLCPAGNTRKGAVEVCLPPMEAEEGGPSPFFWCTNRRMQGGLQRPHISGGRGYHFGAPMNAEEGGAGGEPPNVGGGARCSVRAPRRRAG